VSHQDYDELMSIIDDRTLKYIMKRYSESEIKDLFMSVGVMKD
jgi:hypothetical protein